MKQLKSLITIQKLAEKLWNFEKGLSDDFVCQYNWKTLCPECILSCHGNFYTETVYWWVAVIMWGPVWHEGDHWRLMSEGTCQSDCMFSLLNSSGAEVRGMGGIYPPNNWTPSPPIINLLNLLNGDHLVLRPWPTRPIVSSHGIANSS